MIEYKKYIALNPHVRFGKPTIIGTRITVFDVLNLLANGMSKKEIIDDFPEHTNMHQSLSFLLG